MATVVDTIHNDMPPGPEGPGHGGEAVRDAQPVNDRALRSDYVARQHIFPSKVRGKFRNVKWALVAILLGIYWAVPWIRWDRGAAAPDQAAASANAGSVRQSASPARSEARNRSGRRTSKVISGQVIRRAVRPSLVSGS